MKETDNEQLERRKHAASVRRDQRESNRRAFPRWPLEFEVRFGTGKEMTPAEGYEIGEGGLSFPGEGAPAYLDFAYFAFTLGICFQTSDVTITKHDHDLPIH